MLPGHLPVPEAVEGHWAMPVGTKSAWRSSEVCSVVTIEKQVQGKRKSPSEIRYRLTEAVCRALLGSELPSAYSLAATEVPQFSSFI